MLTEQLQGALNSRIVIEQAKGMLAQIHGVTTDEGFERLRSYCRKRARASAKSPLHLSATLRAFPTSRPRSETRARSAFTVAGARLLGASDFVRGQRHDGYRAP